MPPGQQTRITDFSHHDSAFARDPFNTITRLLTDEPVAWSTKHDGFWVVNRFDDVTSAFRDYRTFSSQRGAAIPVLNLGGDHIPVSMDPPQHAQYRKVLNPWFTAEAIAAREDGIRAFVREVIEPLAKVGEWDFVPDVANVVPGSVILGIIGFGAQRRAEFLSRMELAMSHQASTDPDTVEQIKRDKEWIDNEILELMRARRAKPEGDLMSVLANDPLGDGNELTDEQMLGVGMLLVLAGFHTTSAAFAAMMVHLSKHPDQRQWLIEDFGRIPAAIEEIIRVYSPATAEGRYVTQDVELGGETLNAGDMVLLNIAAANKDPSKFEDPFHVDFQRDNRRAISFGWGVHRCLGQHLAKAILRIEIETVLESMPGYVVDLEKTVVSDAMGIGFVHDAVPARLVRP
ncbi:cytochrome P450 (plasmid) [Mycolicibacterium madagascariense]|uniref:Cytochrome P450 n=1 Tax=Mycolicibacterium madagascariense TaxID=212765 RepID=A0A7I7XQC7_9MYCO|nr:cytochrome P450 [Mycolicibacterium madagascariense]BBZ31242.1 cytochrome P450 [Mycolicibacterium madagascariense]